MKKKKIILLIILIPTIIFALDKYLKSTDSSYDNSKEWKYIHEHENEYPDSLVQLALRNKETLTFVYDYKNNKDKEFSMKLIDDLKSDEIPLLLQWDERWGYKTYGDEYMAVNGCGPTCLSMVVSYLKQNSSLHPYYIAEYAYKRGYLQEAGTSWNLMTIGARDLGLKVEELPLEEGIIKKNLERGRPIICSVSKGIFTSSGHFIVLKEYKDGLIYVNDPNSIEKSHQGYTFNQIQYQIKNLWAYNI